MRLTKESTTIINSDLDGVLIHAPIPFVTFMRLLSRTFDIPELEEQPDAVGQPDKLTLKDRWSIFYHGIRPMKNEAVLQLCTIAKQMSLYSQPFSLRILSGRTPELHSLTRQQVTSSPVGRYLDQQAGFLLNHFDSSSTWKEWSVKQMLTEDPTCNVIHIEDDVKAALRVARLDTDRVMVFLLDNRSNRETLLKKNQLEMPPNVIRVKNMSEVTTHLTGMLMQSILGDNFVP